MKNKKKICIVEDDFAARLVYKNSLEELYDIKIYNTGNEFLLNFGKCNPDIFIIDFHLPDISGLSIIKTLRSNPYFDDKPILVVTADYLPVVKDEIENFKNLKLINKPFTPSSIKEQISSL